MRALDQRVQNFYARFWGSGLGSRLKRPLHMEEDDAAKSEAGDAVLNGLRGINSPRVNYCRAWNGASDCWRKAP